MAIFQLLVQRTADNLHARINIEGGTPLEAESNLLAGLRNDLIGSSWYTPAEENVQPMEEGEDYFVIEAFCVAGTPDSIPANPTTLISEFTRKNLQVGQTEEPEA